MGSRVRMVRVAAVTALTLAVSVLAAPNAGAVFHLMKVREVAPNPAGADSSFIELQMYAGGQNQVSGHVVNSYNAAGNLLGSFTMTGNVANGENQRTILLGDNTTPGNPDFVDPNFYEYLSTISAGGAVCFENLDCVSWGNFAGFAGVTPSPPGTPAPAIPNGSSLERSILPNCPTLLESADDANNSVVDFGLAAPTPRNNATPPTETPCTGLNPGGGPDTKIDKGPKKKTRKKRATFQFSSPTPAVSFECSVDGKPFTPCTSPHTVKVKTGKHRFRVRAVLNGVADGSPAEHTWKRKKKRRR